LENRGKISGPQKKNNQQADVSFTSAKDERGAEEKDQRMNCKRLRAPDRGR